ncbi:MAG: acyl carrier protein [Clostridia bacterium]|nr:acyl carrier protein [Clostridia bacterium]
MFEKVKSILVDELQLNEEDITLEAELVNDLGINSLELADLIMVCEEKFNIEIGDDDIRKFITVSDICDYLEKLAN